MINLGIVRENVLCFQAASADNNGSDDDQKQDGDLDYGKEVVEPNAKAARDGMDEAGEDGGGNCNATDGVVAGVVDTCGGHGTHGEADGISSHIAKRNERDAKDACTEKHRALAIGGFSVHVLKIIEISSTSGH